jgi:hypothetical protein
LTKYFGCILQMRFRILAGKMICRNTACKENIEI